jgi:hypothetical protein
VLNSKVVEYMMEMEGRNISRVVQLGQKEAEVKPSTTTTGGWYFKWWVYI